MSVKVSVITAVHNRLHLLRRALDSVFAQEAQGDLFDLETIVVDDASDDVSEDEIRRVIGASPVRYIRRAVNGGLSAARNIGIRASSGDYVAFLDDDDEFLPQKLRTQIPVLINEPEIAMVYGPCVARAPDGTEEVWTGGPSGAIFRDLLLRGNFMQVGTVLLRRKVLEEHSGFGEAMRASEDYDLWLRIAYHSKIAYVEKPVSIFSHSAGKFIRDLEDGTVLRSHLEIADNIASYAPKEADFARQRLELVWMWNVRWTLSRNRALRAVQEALRAYPSLARNAPLVKLLSILIRENALGDVSPISFTASVCESIPPRLHGAIWRGLCLSFLKRREGGLALRAARRALSAWASWGPPTGANSGISSRR